MLEKQYDRKELIEAAKKYAKVFASIEENPIDIMIDPFSILLEYDPEVNLDREWADIEDYGGVDVYAPPGKNKRIAYLELLNLDELLSWYHSLS